MIPVPRDLKGFLSTLSSPNDFEHVSKVSGLPMPTICHVHLFLAKKNKPTSGGIIIPGVSSDMIDTCTCPPDRSITEKHLLLSIRGNSYSLYILPRSPMQKSPAVNSHKVHLVTPSSAPKFTKTISPQKPSAKRDRACAFSSLRPL